MCGHFRELFERFIHRQIVTTVFKNFLITTIYFFLGTNLAFSKVPGADSIHTHNLKEVNVNGQALKVVRAALPVQIFSEKEISTLNASNVSDIAKHFAGVTVKDYGGIGGMKTVSLRGLGALHTGVSYDGVMMSDVQSGQIDLGRFSIENISEISLSNGQPNDIFQSASMFASSGVLSFSTKMPEYDMLHTLAGKITAKVGSFGLINPVVFLCKNFTKKWEVSLNADGLVANGQYKYAENINNQGSNLVEKYRINSDVQSIRSELNSTYHINTLEFISFKANQFYSERGLPGPDILYSTYSTDRLLDKNYFAQIHYENKQSNYFQYQILAKYNGANMKFTEISPNYPDFPDHKRIDSYLQNEYYLSGTLQFHPLNNLTVSTSMDGWYNDLFSNSNLGFRKDALPTRYTGLVNVAAKYVNDRITMGANVLYTLTKETNQTGDAAPDRNKLSPTVSISYKLLENKEVRLRAFYKNIFRLPTFSDLYYHDFGFVNLQPEVTNQFNVGLVYRELEIPFVSELEMSIDAYYNNVTDKITVMYGMPYSSIRNIGKVDIKGCDANIKLTVPLNKSSYLNIRANYTFQLAQDRTVGSQNYGEQIPYTPFHSGSGSVSYQHKRLEGGYNVLYSGKRWDGQNNDTNLLKAYIEHSLFGKIKMKKIMLMGEIINLLDSQYEIVKNYPMPGRNYRITLGVEL